MSGEFGRKQVFPAPAGLVGETNPGEVKNLVDQNPLKLTRL